MRLVLLHMNIEPEVDSGFPFQAPVCTESQHPSPTVPSSWMPLSTSSSQVLLTETPVRGFWMLWTDVTALTSCCCFVTKSVNSEDFMRTTQTPRKSTRSMALAPSRSRTTCSSISSSRNTTERWYLPTTDQGFFLSDTTLAARNSPRSTPSTWLWPLMPSPSTTVSGWERRQSCRTRGTWLWSSNIISLTLSCHANVSSD